jgi:putative MATE family efflux protein
LHDLTEGSIPRHVLKLAAPIAIGMFFQTMYYLVDLYFVAQLGEAAIAGVSTAGNVQFLVMALTQVLGVGTMALIAHAVGRKDRDDAGLIFNQSLLLAGLCASATLIVGYSLAGWYTTTVGADAATATAGRTYLYWFLPGLGLQFGLVSMGSALRGTGVVQPTMVVQMSTVLLNAILAPIMIAGWFTGRPLGVMGAGVSSSIAVAVGVVMMLVYFMRLGRYVEFDARLLRPRIEAWKRILRVGVPPGGEFALMFVYIGVVYWSIRGFGAQAQAAYGVGSRVMQAIFLPAMAIAFAAAPLAGQNMGAARHSRVRETFRTTALLGSALMFILTLLCQIRPEPLIGVFTADPEVVRLGGEFLRIISWNFVAVGLVFTCSSMFQGLGNTLPALGAAGSRLLTYVIPMIWLASRPGFQLAHLWYLSVVSVASQAALSWWLLQRELHVRLDP